MNTVNDTKHHPLWMYFIIIFAICLAGLTIYYYQNKPTAITLVASGHPEWPPVMWQADEKIIGAGPDLVQKICTDLKINCDIKYEGQWQEVQDKAKTGEVDMLVAAYKTPEREQYMNYSDAYTVDPITLFIKSGNNIGYKDWNSLIGKKGVVMTGDSYGQEFDNFIKNNLTVNSVSTAQEAFKQITDGKADYFVYGLYSGKNEIKKDKLTGIESIPSYVATENFYITISKQSPFASYMPQINALIRKYQADGTIKKLIEQNAINSGIENK